MAAHRISVIITAHDRRAFVLSAVRSVRASGTEGKGAELLVVVNYQDPLIEAGVRAEGARLLTVDAQAVGAKLEAGIRATYGEILCFLEDDDLFAREKLAAVREVFEREQDLVYFHHNVQVMGAGGEPLAPESYRGDTIRTLARLGSLRMGPSERATMLPQLPMDPYFSASAIAVRRTAVAPHLTVLREVNLVPDCFLFFASLLSKGALRWDGRPLTTYRLHGSNASSADPRSPGDFLGNMSAWSRGIAPSLEAIERMVAAGGGGPELHAIRGVRAVQEVYAVLRDPGSHRGDMRRALTALREHRDTYSWKTHRSVRWAARAFLLSPLLARRLYQRRKARDRTAH